MRPLDQIIPRRQQRGRLGVQRAGRLADGVCCLFSQTAQRLKNRLGLCQGVFAAPGALAANIEPNSRFEGGERRRPRRYFTGLNKRAQAARFMPHIEQLIRRLRPAARRLPARGFDKRRVSAQRVERRDSVGFPGSLPDAEQISGQGRQIGGDKIRQGGAQRLSVVLSEQPRRTAGRIVERGLQRGVERAVHDDACFNRVEHGEIRVKAGLSGVGAQQRRAQAVNRVNAGAVYTGQASGPHGAGLVVERAAQALFKRLAHTIAHFLGCLACERDRHQSVERPVGVAVEQREVAFDQHARLAGAGSGDDDQVAPVFAHGLFLLRRHLHGSVCLPFVAIDAADAAQLGELAVSGAAAVFQLARGHAVIAAPRRADAAS